MNHRSLHAVFIHYQPISSTTSSANTIQMSSSVFIHSICWKECKAFWLQSLVWPNMDWNEENDVTLPHSIELHQFILPVHKEKNRSTEDNHTTLSKSTVFSRDVAWRGMKSFRHIVISYLPAFLYSISWPALERITRFAYLLPHNSDWTRKREKQS